MNNNHYINKVLQRITNKVKLIVTFALKKIIKQSTSNLCKKPKECCRLKNLLELKINK